MRHFANLGLILLSAVWLVQPACSSTTQDFSRVAPDGTDLSGSWVLDTQQSDDPREAIRQLGEGGSTGPPRSPGVGSAPPEGGPPRMPGGRPSGDRARPHGDNFNPEGIRYLIETAGDPLERLDIQHTDSSFAVTGAYGSIYHLPTDGSVVKQEWEGYWTVNLRAGWIDSGLVVQREIDHTGKLTETFSLSPDGQMYVVVRLNMERARDPVEFRLVYRPATRRR